MSSLPPPPPFASSGLGKNEALSKVEMPGLLLAIIGGLGVAGSLLGLALNIVGGVGALARHVGDEQRFVSMFSGGAGIVISIVALAFYAVVVLGALKMRALESYGLAVAAAIIAMLPCPPVPMCCCCFFGLPIGIWSLVVLMDQNVKAHFSS